MMLKINFFIGVICLLGLGTKAQTNANFLTSGQAIKNGTANGIGQFASPSLTGVIAGMAKVNDDDDADLFLTGDARRPGTYLYHFKKFTEKGEPVFSQGEKIKLPFEETGGQRTVVIQTPSKKIHGFWRFGGKMLKSATFDRNANAFGKTKDIAITGLPSGATTFGVIRTVQGKYLFLFTISKPNKEKVKITTDSAYYTPEGFWPNDLNEVGIYGAVANSLDNLSKLEAKQLTSLDQTYYGISGYTSYEDNTEQYLIYGTRFGNIHAHNIINEELAPLKYVIDKNHILHRSPSVNGYVAYFKGSQNKEGLFVSGEGSIVFYPNTKQKDKNGNLIFSDALPLKQENPLLYGGSLVVPSLADWDGDGVIDMISGNSVGKILFFKNTGTNQNPAYQDPVALKAGGIDIHVQPGYREDIQGPQEARWGYVCPVVYDWNGDGLPDILFGDSRGKFMVHLNIGTKTKPELAVEKPLYIKGLDVHGGWRSTPGVANMAGKDAYVILDADNQFHLYYKIDAYNISDGGKLKLTDGSYINGHRRKGGQVGRAKIHIVDWDGDGVKDMLVGTGRGASIPNAKTGLPYNRKKKNEGAAVLFMRNVGTDSEPVFEFPKMMKFKGEDILLGAHECAPTTAYIGGNGKTLNLVVGTEYGTYMFYDRKDLSW
ncbi:VCBS repeat-containing protein [Pedobacter sp. UBA4863]|uniref:FG-GAP repeat domain-containing protein n=1 Tax=Pedobacter sp. UBA4863 TaxID=1947060 RepID=UPI0025FEE352|nr:VCBS repeat-containing protein [Pedobacter sp. UBA4863]